MPVYHRQAVHRLSFYERSLHVILAGMSGGCSQARIAQMLTDAGIPAPMGGEHTVDSLKALLKSFRARRGRFFDAALSLVFEGRMTREQLEPLLQAMR